MPLKKDALQNETKALMEIFLLFYSFLFLEILHISVEFIFDVFSKPKPKSRLSTSSIVFKMRTRTCISFDFFNRNTKRFYWMKSVWEPATTKYKIFGYEPKKPKPLPAHSVLEIGKWFTFFCWEKWMVLNWNKT